MVYAVTQVAAAVFLSHLFRIGAGAMAMGVLFMSLAARMARSTDWESSSDSEASSSGLTIQPGDLT